MDSARASAAANEGKQRTGTKSAPRSVTRSAAPIAVPAAMRSAIPSGGQTLPNDLRADMETRFGQDFSDVIIHEGQGAERLASQQHANAYALATHIVFGTDRFAPATPEGQHLIAHELAHVVQQRRGGPPTGASGSTLEVHADNAADAAVPGAQGVPVGGNAGVGIMCDKDDDADEGEHEEEKAFASPAVQRLGDPGSTDAWEFASNYQEYEPWTYEKLLTGVPPKLESLQIEATTGSLGEGQLQLLVRLTALDLMRQYRDSVMAQRDSLRKTDQSSSVEEASAAARQILEFDAKRRILERSRSQLADLGTLTNTGGLWPFTESWASQVAAATREFRNDAITGALEEFAQWVNSHREEISDADRFQAVALLLALVRARSQQIKDTTRTINDAYRKFPFLAHSYVRDAIAEEAEAFMADPVGDLTSASASVLESGASAIDLFDPTGLLADVRGFAGSAIRSWAGPTVQDFAEKTFGTDASYVDAMRHGYDRLIENIDYAIGMIGSEDINPFELPAAVEAAGKNSPNLAKELERLRKRRELISLATNLGLSILEAGLALLPVVGPALAFATSMYSSVTDFESTMDRKAIGMAGATPEGTLGVNATSREVFASGVGVVASALEIVDVIPGHVETPDLSEARMSAGTRADVSAVELPDSAAVPPAASILEPPASSAGVPQRAETLLSPAADLESSVALSSGTDSSALTARQKRNEATWVDLHREEVVSTTPSHREASIGGSNADHKIVRDGNGPCIRHSEGGVEVPCPLSLLEPPSGSWTLSASPLIEKNLDSVPPLDGKQIVDLRQPDALNLTHDPTWAKPFNTSLLHQAAEHPSAVSKAGVGWTDAARALIEEAQLHALPISSNQQFRAGAPAQGSNAVYVWYGHHADGTIQLLKPGQTENLPQRIAGNLQDPVIKDWYANHQVSMQIVADNLGPREANLLEAAIKNDYLPEKRPGDLTRRRGPRRDATSGAGNEWIRETMQTLRDQGLLPKSKDDPSLQIALTPRSINDAAENRAAQILEDALQSRIGLQRAQGLDTVRHYIYLLYDASGNLIKPGITEARLLEKRITNNLRGRHSRPNASESLVNTQFMGEGVRLQLFAQDLNSVQAEAIEEAIGRRFNIDGNYYGDPSAMQWAFGVVDSLMSSNAFMPSQSLKMPE